MVHPVMYKPEYDALYVDMRKAGKSVDQCAVFFGVSEPTIYNWVKKHKSFAAHKELGDTYYRAWFMEHYLSGMTGDNPKVNPALTIFMAKQVLQWKDKQELSGDQAAPIPSPVIVLNGNRD
jgi:hypothetical protein